MFGTISSAWEILLAVGVVFLSYYVWKRTRRRQTSKNGEPTKFSAKGGVLASEKGGDDAEKKKIQADGTDNPAYDAEEWETKIAAQNAQQPSPEKTVVAQPRLQPGSGCKRQISDLSAVSSEFAPSNGKELSEMVLEGLEKSFSNDKTIKDLEKSFHGRDTKPVKPAEPSAEPSTVSKEDGSDQDVAAQPTAIGKSDGQEWRNKLMQDLDDDEEFVLSSSEEEEEEEDDDEEPEAAEKRPRIEDLPAAIDENTKPASARRENSVNNPDIKCGGVPVVVDAGSYEVKAGLAGEFAPTYRFRTVIGKWRSQVGEAYREQYGDVLFADEALSKHNALALKYPIQDGVIEDWKDFESILEYVLSHLQDVDIKNHPLLITEHATVTKKQREKQLEVVMEALNCPMTQFRSQAALSAITAGADVALVVNSGHGCTEIVPMYHGYAIQNAVRKVNVGGRHITEYLGRLLLKERGVNFSSVADRIVLEEMKIKYAETGNEGRKGAGANSQTIQHELPDGKIIELGAEVSRCTQPIFSPELIGDSDGLGLVEAIKQSVNSLDPDIRSSMKSSVLLAGGNCRLNGLQRHVEEQLLAGEKGGRVSWRVTPCHDLTNCAWVGGSVFADSDTFREDCVTDDAYFEYGASIIHRTCF